jgi:acetoin utilization protein AcuB
MFAMYDDDGLNFRNTIDHLYDVHEVAPSRRIKNTRKEDNEQKFNTLYKGSINEEAKDKYRQIANMDTKLEIFHVEQVMSHKPIIINDDKTLGECYELMKEQEIRQLLIRSDKSNYLKGMITQTMILDYITENLGEEELFETEISNIYEQNIITTDPITDVRRAAKVMIDFNRNAIPVVDAGHQILGVVTRYDIVKAVSNMPHLQIWA